MQETPSATGKPFVTRGKTLASATVAAVTLSGLGLAPAVHAETASACPEVYPIESLVKDQALTGLTVAEGTTPQPFAGEVIGVLDDGVALGVDMILARLSSDEIDRVGVWSGMSGSPVYAEDGRLVGAVAYTLSSGATPVAGLTPAAEMASVLAGADVSARSADTEVSLPDRLQDRMVAQGDATARQADSGMAPLRLPLGISGLGPQRRYTQIDESLRRAGKTDGLRTFRMGVAGAGTADASDITAGGNLAAAISYGDVSYAALGTATMVCGSQVIGFGHPFLWTGPAALSMHPAEALYVQEDGAFSGFKVGNLGPAVGSIDQDRIAGIAGATGTPPHGARITTSVTAESRSRDGRTDVYQAEWVPDIALTALLANADRIFDGIGEGTAGESWTIKGRRADGSRFSVTRSDRYADEDDITWASVLDLYHALSRIQYGTKEDVTISRVAAQADLDRTYDHATVSKVFIKRAGTWRRVGADPRQVLSLRIRQTHKLRVKLQTPHGPEWRFIDIPTKRRDLGQRGRLQVRGGDYGRGFGGYYYYDDSDSGPDLDEVLSDIAAAPRNDDVIAKLRLRKANRSRQLSTRERRVATDTVTDGAVSVRMKVVR